MYVYLFCHLYFVRYLCTSEKKIIVVDNSNHYIISDVCGGTCIIRSIANKYESHVIGI